MLPAMLETAFAPGALLEPAWSSMARGVGPRSCPSWPRGARPQGWAKDVSGERGGCEGNVKECEESMSGARGMRVDGPRWNKASLEAQ